MTTEQLIGGKSVYRIVETLQVIEAISVCGNLITCVSMGCINPNYTYKTFLDSFQKLFLMSSLFINNKKLLMKIEAAFAEDWSYKNPSEFKSNSWRYINLFRAYTSQLKEDGLFNPEITNTGSDINDIFKDSI